MASPSVRSHTAAAVNELNDGPWAVALRRDGELLNLPDGRVPGNEYDVHHIRVPLREGGHPIQIVDTGTEAELLSFSVTYLPPYSLRTPGGSTAKAYAFHTRQGEAGCSACHGLPETFETVRDQPFAPAGKVCAACHPRVEGAPHLHGPVAVHACFMCHAEDYLPSRFQQRTSQGGLCSNCHEGFLAKILGWRACQANCRVLFTTAMNMLNQLVASQVDHSLVRRLKTYTNASRRAGQVSSSELLGGVLGSPKPDKIGVVHVAVGQDRPCLDDSDTLSPDFGG